MKMHLYANCLPAKGFGILLSLSCNPGPHGSTRYLSTTAATAWLSLGKKNPANWTMINQKQIEDIIYLFSSTVSICAPQQSMIIS